MCWRVSPLIQSHEPQSSTVSPGSPSNTSRISLDYDAVVLSDCTSSVTDAVQAGNLADMQRVGATVCASTELTLA